MKTIYLSFLVIAACGGGSDSMDGPGESGADASISETEINGRPASEFYGQFVWQTSGGNVGGAAAFPETDGRDAFVLDVFLMEDKSFLLFYGEGFGQVTSTGHSLNVYPDSYSRREGSWSLEDGELVLGSWARCGGLEFNGNDVLQCRLSQSIVTPEAVGSAGILRFKNETSPFDSEWSEYR